MKANPPFLLVVFFSTLIGLSISNFTRSVNGIVPDPTDLQPLRVTAVITRNFPPEYSIDDEGNPTGFAIDIIEEIAKIDNLIITYEIKNDWLEVQETIKKGQGDIIPICGITESRKVDFLFTSPLQTFPLSIFLRDESPKIKNIHDLAGHKIAVIRTNAGIELLENNPEIYLKIFSDPDKALFELLAGKVDAVVYPEPILLKIARDIGVEDRLQIVDQPLAEIKRAIAVRKDNIILQKRLDQAVQKLINSSKYQEIYLKWYGKPKPFWTISLILWITGGLFLLIVISIIVWRYISQQAFFRLIEAKKALEASENRYRGIVEDQTELICRFLPDGTITFVNQAYCRYFNLQAEDLIGKQFFPLIPQEDQEKIKASFTNIALENPLVTHEHQVIDHQGNIRWHQWTNRGIFDSQGQLIELQGVGRDITLLKQAEIEIRQLNSELENRVKERTKELEIANHNLQEAKEKYESILNTALDAFCVVDSHENPGRFLDVNEAFCKMSGYSREELLTMSINQIEANESGEITMAHIHKIITTGSDFFESRHRCKDRSIIDLEISVNYIPSRKIMVSFMRDITHRKRMEEELRYKTLHDTLTDLPNRVLFMELVEQALKRCKRHENYLFAVLFIDLDRFKIVNDSLGHWAGDQLLIAIARKLEKCVRETDTVARLGGDEFTILLDDLADYQKAIKIAERINQALRSPFLINNQEVFMTASIGIVFNNAEYHHGLDVLRNADLAMYRAKDQGKARYAIFDQQMRIEINRFLELETNLRLGIERQEFRLYYQPIVDLTTGKLYGFEALVRWQHPQQGLVSPLEFIPIAEETGLIIALGEWILSESFHQLKQWQQQFPEAKSLTISANLSGKQLENFDVIKLLDLLLTKTALDPQYLKLEITESMLIGNLETAYQILLEIRQRNIAISIDDFGTGYSSLSYLHQFPIDTLKIDKSFVSRISDDGNNLEIVEAIVSLAKNLNMDVIAEGIETKEQLLHLQRLGCEFGQGYLFSRPLPSQEVERFILSKSRFRLIDY